MAEHLARAFLDDALGVSGVAIGVGSAGTHAVVGHEMEQLSAAVLRGLGGNPAGFRARQLTAEMVEGADLTLTMTRRHRRDVLKLAPGAMFRTYTLREAAALLGRIPPDLLPAVTPPADRLRALAAALGTQRATRRSTDPDADDVRDPMGSRADVHQAVGDQIEEALVPLLRALCGTPQDGGVSRFLPPEADQPSVDAQTTRITRYRPPIGRYGSSMPAR
jgi:protein-tyrosine-phosphatase